jgi:hypothetical protein
MKLSEFKSHLEELSTMQFRKENGESVPVHFHITEAGLITRHFMDCGDKVRLDKKINFQIWVYHDIHHRLSPQKLLGIINKSAPLFEDEDLDIEVEYQTDTIGRYGLDFQDGTFILTSMETDCLAKEVCFTPQKIKQKLSLKDLTSQTVCTPGTGCC